MQMSTKFVKYTFLANLALLIFVLLYPFNFKYPIFSAKTNVRWLSETNGIEISSISTIVSPSPPERLYKSLVSGKGLTLEIWLKTENDKQYGPARIISYSYNKYLRNFTLGQEGKKMVLRLRTTETNLNGTDKQFFADDIFQLGKVQHIVVTYDYEKERLYLNGKEISQSSVLKGDFSNWDSSYPFILGNEFSGNRPWNGKIFLVAIYSRALSEQDILKNYQSGRFFVSYKETSKRHVSDDLVSLYLFSERKGIIVRDQSGFKNSINLQIPHVMDVTNKVLLRTPYQNYSFNLEDIKDLAINIIAFMPFGLLLSYLGMKRGQSFFKFVCITVFLGTLFSLSIEFLQYFLVSRSSSLTDVIHNTVGVFLGAVLALLLCGSWLLKKGINKIDHRF